MDENKKWIISIPSLDGIYNFELKFTSDTIKECLTWNETRIKCDLIDLQTENKLVLYETQWYDTTGCSYARRSGRSKCFLDVMTWVSKHLL